MDETTRTTLRGESTRDALLTAATQVFAREGFGSANLREIAQAAEVNQALIGYHFHGKEGLYHAVFERIVNQMQAVLHPVLVEIDRVLEDPVGACPPGQRKERYLEPLLQLLETMLTYMVHEHPSLAELFVREQQTPTAAFEILYEGLIKHGQRAFAGLVQRIRPDEDPVKVRLLAATIVSQVIVVRIARVPLMRLMQWERIGDPELAAMRELVRRNTTLLVLGE
jgi:TetR/AcrR family transcriptional regulator, regulator of cefoperazone and chloramphenicol sensitivity